MVQYDTSRQDSHSLSRKPKVGDVRTNSLRVRVVAEPEALVQLLDLRVRRNLHGRPLHILLLGSLGLGDDALDLLGLGRLARCPCLQGSLRLGSLRLRGLLDP